jgi:hypothetical protein
MWINQHTVCYHNGGTLSTYSNNSTLSSELPVLGYYYTVSSDNFLLMFWDNLLDPLKMGLTDCPEASVRNDHY